MDKFWRDRGIVPYNERFLLSGVSYNETALYCEIYTKIRKCPSEA